MAEGVQITHHCTYAQALLVEEVFAYMTEVGWVVPDWVELLKATAGDCPR